MASDILFENFSLIMDTPNSVQKMRELILQLAVQGKLIPQDPKDEPAANLIEQLKAKKLKLIENKKIKRKRYSEISPDEIPYDTPKGWVWIRFGELGEICGGGTPSKNKAEYWNGEIKWVSPKDMKTDYIKSSEMTITDLALSKTTVRLVPKGSILIVARSGILKRLLPVAVTDIDCTVNQDIKVLIPFDSNLSNYIRLMLKGHEKYILKELVKGGMTVQSLKYDDFENQPFPLPPIQEQKRIVEKVDQLMALCDELEVQQQKAVDKRKQLNNSAIDNTLTAEDTDEFANNWQLICENFDLLYDNSENVDKLRQAILQMAVQGKLVPQDANDEPASELLKKIKVEKDRLIKLKKIKKSKPLPPVDSNEMPFELPQGWIWVNMETVCFQITDGTHYTPHYTEKGIHFLSVKDISSGTIDLSQTRFISPDEHENLIKRCKPEFEDVLLTKVGTTGIAKVIDVKVPFSIFVSLALLKFPKKFLSPYFLELLINSPLVRNQSATFTQGVGNKNLVLKHIKNFYLPLAPINEQKRIVTKVDQLLALCDELQARLTQSQDDSGKLLDAVLYETLAA